MLYTWRRSAHKQVRLVVIFPMLTGLVQDQLGAAIQSVGAGVVKPDLDQTLDTVRFYHHSQLDGGAGLLGVCAHLLWGSADAAGVSFGWVFRSSPPG